MCLLCLLYLSFTFLVAFGSNAAIKSAKPLTLELISTSIIFILNGDASLFFKKSDDVDFVTKADNTVSKTNSLVYDKKVKLLIIM